MTETTEAIKIHRGLKGVYFERSACTFIDGKAGDLRYRGYSIHDLAEHSSFEETAWLLLNGELPVGSERKESYTPAQRSLALYLIFSGHFIKAPLPQPPENLL